MAAGDLLIDPTGDLVISTEGDLTIHDGVTEECCCGGGCSDDCCACGTYYFSEVTLPTFNIRERVRNFNSAADCAAQTGCVTTTFNKYTDWAAVDPFECGHWKSTKISSFATTPCEAMPAADDARWETPVDLDGGCEIRYNCDTNEWEFKIPAQGDVWYSLGAGTNDGVSGTHDYGCIEILDPVYERHDVSVAVIGATCTPCEACPDCAEVEIANVTLGGDGAIGYFPAWDCECSNNPNAYNAARTYEIYRDITGTYPVLPGCVVDDIDAFEAPLAPTGDFAGASSGPGNAGSGANTVDIYVTDSVTSNPIENAVVILKIGATVYKRRTNASGLARFFLDSDTYTLDIYCGGYADFTAETGFVVDGNESEYRSLVAGGNSVTLHYTAWAVEDHREYLILPPYLEQQTPGCCWLGQAYVWYSQCVSRELLDGSDNPYRYAGIGDEVEPGDGTEYGCCYCVNNYDIELCFEFFDAESNSTTIRSEAATYTATLTTTAIATNCPGLGSFAVDQTWADQAMPLTTPWAKTGLTFTVGDSNGGSVTLELDLTLCPDGV
jgi:hypothetical protein